MARASIDSHNQAPRKVRLVTNLVKGKSVAQALIALQFLPKRASEPIAKLIKSAVASAKLDGEDVGTLVIQDITVESAGMLKRYMPRAMGRATLIRHKKSRIKLILASSTKSPAS